jgi:hypothetical protein
VKDIVQNIFLTVGAVSTLIPSHTIVDVAREHNIRKIIETSEFRKLHPSNLIPIFMKEEVVSPEYTEYDGSGVEFAALINVNPLVSTSWEAILLPDDEREKLEYFSANVDFGGQLPLNAEHNMSINNDWEFINYKENDGEDIFFSVSYGGRLPIGPER